MLPGIKEQAYWGVEPAFLWDHLNFGNDLRDYVALQVAEVAESHNQVGKHLAFLTILSAMMAGFEDLAALLLGLRRRYAGDTDCGYQKEFSVAETPLMFSLMNYRGDIRLDTLLGSRTPEGVFLEFHFDRLVPTSPAKPADLTPDMIRQGLRYMAKSISEDFVRNQTKNDRCKASNKIKHGALVVSEGRRFFPGRGYPSGPGVLMTGAGNPAEPLQCLILPYSEMELQQMQRMIWLSKMARKILITLYLWTEYRQFMESKSVSDYGILFDEDMRRIIACNDDRP